MKGEGVGISRRNVVVGGDFYPNLSKQPLLSSAGDTRMLSPNHCALQAPISHLNSTKIAVQEKLSLKSTTKSN